MTNRAKWFLVYAALIALVAAPAAQPPRLLEAGRQLYERAGRPTTDDTVRPVTKQLAEQMAHDFPGQGWGWKASAPTNPPSKDCVAKVDQVDAKGIVIRGVCYDWIEGTGNTPTNPTVNDIAGQFFIGVDARDHLGGQPPPPPNCDECIRALLEARAERDVAISGREVALERAKAAELERDEARRLLEELKKNPPTCILEGPRLFRFLYSCRVP